MKLLPKSARNRIPPGHQQRFDEVALLIEQFGQQHLDGETSGFAIELWKRICRRRSSDCLRGKSQAWAAPVIHVIARMNFLFDRSEPLHINSDTIADFFQISKRTIGAKATEIERMLRLRQSGEPGLCRPQILEMFAFVRLSNGIVVPWRMARQMGCLPADAKLEDFF